MITSTSLENLETTIDSSPRTSKHNLWSVLFFIMGAPHIYGMMQRKNFSDKLFKGLFNRYLRFAVVAAITGGIMEFFIF
jgi:hypothetical protein